MLEGARLLDGIRVIDAASFIAGPVAATVMADFGADVIKVEPPGGDTYRLRNAGYPPSPYNFPWIVDNRNKRSVALDLRAEEGRRVLHRLVREADVFVTNVPLDGRARLGVRWEDLSPLHPRAGLASIPRYRGTGRQRGGPGGGALPAHPAPRLRLDHRLRRARPRGEPPRLRQHRALGAHRPDGLGAPIAGGPALMLAAPRWRRPHPR